jgi:hypothetical protein
VATSHDGKELVQAAQGLVAGASGFVLKVAADTDVRRAARNVLGGTRYVSPLIHYPDPH